MPSFKDTRILPYSAEFIHNMILDVENYPQFLPWCKSATILSTPENEITAELKINFKNFTEKYISLITTTQSENNFTINVKAISGPFKKLITLWNIENLGEKCEINFFIDFEFKSKLINAIMGSIFFATIEKMITAFEKRAHDLSIKV